MMPAFRRVLCLGCFVLWGTGTLGPSSASAWAQSPRLRPVIAAFQAGRLEEAEKRLEVLLSEGVSEPEALYLRGQIAYAKGQYGDAVQAFRAALPSIPSHLRPWLHNNIGNALLKQKEIKGAIQAYSQALREDPKYERARYNLELACRLLQPPPPPPPPPPEAPPPPPDQQPSKRKPPKPPQARPLGPPDKTKFALPPSKQIKLDAFDRFLPYSKILRLQRTSPPADKK